MQSHSIHVEHLDARYTVGRGQEDVFSVQRRLDGIARNLLARGLEDRFAALNLSGDAVYFVEQMTVDLALNFNRGDEVLAEVWAQALHEGVLRVLSQGGSGLIVFRDRGEYIASFLEDLLRGSAREKWYYREFEPLHAVSVGQAVLKVLTDDADTGRDALLELTRHGDLDLLLVALTDSEVEVVVSKCLSPSGPSIHLLGMYVPWVQALRSLVPLFAWTSVIPRDVARLYLLLLVKRPELGPDVNFVRFVCDVLRLRQTILRMSDRRDFLAMVESEEWAGALTRLEQEREQRFFLASLIREISGPEVGALLRDLQVGSPEVATCRVSTQYGGVFLLVPALIEMGLYDFLSRCPYPEPEGISKSGLLLFMIGLQCL